LVPLTLADVSAFRKLVAGSPGRFPEAKSLAEDGTGRSARAATEVGRVRDIFTPDNLVAGGELLQALYDSLALGDRPVLFARNGMVAWILAFVTPEDLRATLGRVEGTKITENPRNLEPSANPSVPVDAPASALPFGTVQAIAPKAYRQEDQVNVGVPGIPTPVIVRASPQSVYYYPAPHPYRVRSSRCHYGLLGRLFGGR
jgi:hypothetical protein